MPVGTTFTHVVSQQRILVGSFIQRRRMPVELHNPKVEGSSPSAVRKSGVAQR